MEHNDGMPRSDALVMFGATGDLAYKKIFPALYALARRGKLDMPIIGVASSAWDAAQFRQRAADSVAAAGPVADHAALLRMLARLHYVCGDYQDPATFMVLKEALGSAQRPAHYLAIPPAMFETVIAGLGAAGLAAQARVIV